MNTRVINKAFLGNTPVIKLYQGDELVWPLSTDYDDVGVDLGYGIIWSSRNLGASSVEGSGIMYKWGEIFPGDGVYEWSHYTWSDASGNITKYNGRGNKLQLEDDAAYCAANEKLMIPTALQFANLDYYCNSEWTSINGVWGWKYTSRIEGYTDKWIFLPATFYDTYSGQNYCVYWTNQTDAGFRSTNTNSYNVKTAYTYWGDSTEHVSYGGTSDDSRFWANHTRLKCWEAPIRPIIVSGTGSNKIYYTSTNGSVVSTNMNNAISNTYDNGFGIIVFNGSVTTIQAQAFYNKTTLATISLPTSTQIIDSSVFYACTNLNNIVMQDGVTTINNGAFAYCKALTTVILPSTVSSIGAQAFYQDSSLSSINIPEGVKRIEDDTFDGCPSLTSITLPQSIEYIGTFAFYKYSGSNQYLQNITILNPTPPELGSFIFGTGDAPNIYVPAESVNVYKTTTGQWTNWSSFASKIYPIPQ